MSKEIDKEIEREILLNGLRWSNNILTEILSNHAAKVDVEGAKKLREAVASLMEADQLFRKLKVKK